MSEKAYEHEFERGLQNRRAAMSDPFVERAVEQAHSFNADFQHFITRYAWHGVWGRPGLSWKTRRLIVLAITSAMGRWEEFDGHLRGALTPGCEGALTVEEVREALMQFAIYAGVPAANTAFTRATAILRELGYELTPRSADQGLHTGVGQSFFTASRPKLHATIREARSGSPRATVVLSHALGLDGSMWDVLANQLAADYRVICPDTRGHGRSAIPAGVLTLADLADDAARLLTELQVGPVIWLGISMGGMIGQELALRHPDKISALVLANTTSGYEDAQRQAIVERVQAVAAGGLAAISGATMERFFTPLYRARQSASVAQVERLLLACDGDGYQACAHAVKMVDTTARLPAIKVPTLLLAGEHDAGIPVAMMQRMADAMPLAQLRVLPDCAHLSVVEQPRAFLSALEPFWAQHIDSHFKSS